MNLLALRNEVLNHGFDPIAFGARINQYLNDAQALICRRVDYYVDEASLDFNTISGTSNYPQPADFARDRALRETDVQVELTQVDLRMIDRSAPMTGPPRFYALDGVTLHLFPTPDNVYPMELRYWKLPAALVNDTDTSNIPADWHHMLWVYATWLCYEAEDDQQSGQYWMQRFNTELAEFSADQRFPSSDSPSQIADMWNPSPSVGSRGWSVYGTQW